MLKNNVQIVHMGSANKVGGVDPQLSSQDENVRKNGLQFYKDSKFNYEEFLKETHPETGTSAYMAEWEYLKDQVKIGNKEKPKISGSTQSLKLVLANLLVNGEERFEGAKQIVEQYMSVVDNMVRDNATAFFEEIGWDGTQFESLDQLKRVVLNTDEIKNGADNIKNQIENWFNNIESGIEHLPMRRKIENVLYALVSNNIIEFKRPGNSYPQAAVTGYEPFNSRIKLEDNVYESQYLDFYEPVFVDNELQSIKPAEVIIPLPTKWIPDIMKQAKTSNIIDALNWINNQAEIDKFSNGDKFIVKGLRIPNQQLSSNDIFRIKKFTLPTVTSYAIVPSEIVTKVGSD